MAEGQHLAETILGGSLDLVSLVSNLGVEFIIRVVGDSR